MAVTPFIEETISFLTNFLDLSSNFSGFSANRVDFPGKREICQKRSGQFRQNFGANPKST
jgi:hypothetical protein